MFKEIDPAAMKKMPASHENVYVILLTRSNWRVGQAFDVAGSNNTGIVKVHGL
jgi:hypothetical protein